MSADRAAQAKAIFLEAVETPEGERAAFLAKRCGGDARLQAEVEWLLANDEPGGDFLATPVVDVHDRTTRQEEPAPGAGQRIGRYEIRQVGSPAPAGGAEGAAVRRGVLAGDETIPP
jgi:hypothetical protein